MMRSVSVWLTQLRHFLLSRSQPLCSSMLIWPTNFVQVWQTRALLNSGQTASSVSPLPACYFVSMPVSFSPVLIVLMFLPFSLQALRFLSGLDLLWHYFFIFCVSEQRHLVLLRAQLLCLYNPVGKRGTRTERPSPLLQLSAPGHGWKSVYYSAGVQLNFNALTVSCLSLSAWWHTATERCGEGNWVFGTSGTKLCVLLLQTFFTLSNFLLQQRISLYWLFAITLDNMSYTPCKYFSRL